MSTEVPETPEEQVTPEPVTPAAPKPPQSQQTTMSNEEKTMGMLCHLLVFVGLVFPFGNILGPLVLWLMKKDQYPFVNNQGKESLNFQISLSILGVAVGIVTAILGVIPVLGHMLAAILWLASAAIGIYALIQIITATMQANQGVAYRYPYKYEFIK